MLLMGTVRLWPLTFEFRRPPSAVSWNEWLGVCRTWVEEVEQSIGRRCHSSDARAQQLAFRDQDLHIDGLENTFYLMRSNELRVEPWNDANQLPAGLLEANLHIANLECR